MDTKFFEDMASRRTPYFKDMMRALDVVRKFIIKKNLIIYGGMAIDLSLKSVDAEGIYSEDTIPDYDFYSPDFFRDSIELADILHDEGFDQISAINATHISTRRVRVGFIVVADISYMPPTIYEKIPTVQAGDIRVVHPHFQFLDMHREFTMPLENPPLETFFFRTKKGLSRYKLLDAAFPFKVGIDELAKEETKLKIQWVEDDGLIGGFVAFALYNSLFSRIVGLTGSDWVPDVDVDIETKVQVLTSSGRKRMSDKITINASLNRVPKKVKIVTTLYTEQFEKYRYNAMHEFERFLDDVRPQKFIMSPTHEVFSTVDRFYPYTTIDGINVTSVQTVLLYMLACAFTSGDKGFYVYYDQLRQIIASAERIYEKTGNEKVRGMCKQFFLPEKIYGSSNVSDVYKYSIQKMRNAIEHKPDEDVQLRPPRGYFRNQAESFPPEYQSFNIRNSYLYQFEGKEIKNHKK